MAEKSTRPFFNETKLGLTTLERTNAHRADQNFEGTGIPRSLDMQGCFTVKFTPAAPPNNNTEVSHLFVAPFPIQVVAADNVVGSIGGTSANVMLQKKPTGAGSFENMLDAADNLTAGSVVQSVPEDADDSISGKLYLLEKGEEFRVQFTGVGAGAVNGAESLVWMRRQ